MLACSVYLRLDHPKVAMYISETKKVSSFEWAMQSIGQCDEAALEQPGGRLLHPELVILDQRDILTNMRF